MNRQLFQNIFKTEEIFKKVYHLCDKNDFQNQTYLTSGSKVVSENFLLIA